MLSAVKRLIRKALSPVDNRGGWRPFIAEGFSGAWQRNIVVAQTDALQYWAVFRCVSIIASDIAKMRLKLVEQDSDAIWNEIKNPSFSPVIRKPNPIQTRIQFFQNWMESKLLQGNTYVLKVRDNRNVVTQLRVLDPCRVTVLIADNGDVFYRLTRDNVASVENDVVTVPASEIIHDRGPTFYHPLVGLSPISAVGINALAGLRIEQNSARLFTNGARPAGILTAPGAIGDETASRLKTYWDENFTGENAGKVAVLGDGLEYTPMVMTAVDAQLIEQLKWNDASIAGAFGVPAYMINAGQAPSVNNVEALTQQYYSQCLQVHIEAIEILLDEGLGLTEITGKTYGTAFDLDDLLRMDTATLVKTAGEGVARGILTPNEARAKLGYSPVNGGNSAYLQQQNYSLDALAKRDAKDDPFASTSPPPAATAPTEDPPEDVPAANDNEIAQEAAKALNALTMALIKKDAA